MNDIENDQCPADSVETLHEPGLPDPLSLADPGPPVHRSAARDAPGDEGDFVGAETTELLKLAAREAIGGPAADTGLHATLEHVRAEAVAAPVLEELGAVIGEAGSAHDARELPPPAAPAGDELGGILQDFALRLDGCVDALMGERGHALEQHYRQELRRVREEADAAFRAREAALRAELDEDYRRKEQTLRSNYRKLVETANRMKQQKAQLQQARQQFEEKLDAVNALHRKVEDMRRQLRDHLGPEAS